MWLSLLPSDLSPLGEELRRACAGEAGARAALVQRHGPMIWALCRRSAPPDQVEDAYQEAWAHIFARLHRFQPEGPASLQTWLGLLTQRLLIDRHRRRSAERGRREDLALDELLDDGPGAGELLAEAAERAQLRQGLERLPADSRRLLVAHHVEGRPLAELAREEGASLSALKSRLHRARARLAEALWGER
jgi:RNA polymerase sigma-70 factor (ECF subfamily)